MFRFLGMGNANVGQKPMEYLLSAMTPKRVRLTVLKVLSPKALDPFAGSDLHCAPTLHPRCLRGCLRRVQRVVASHAHSPRLASWCARSSYVPCPWLQQKLCHKRMAGVSPEKGVRLIIRRAQTGALCHHSDYILVLDS